MPLHSKEKYRLYAYRAIWRLEKLWDQIINCETRGESALYGFLFLGYLHEIIDGIHRNDLESFQRIGLDKMPLKIKKELLNARNATFHFAQNIDTAHYQETGLINTSEGPDNLRDLYFKIVDYKNELFTHFPELEEMKSALEKPAN